jgi:cell division cycle 14
MATNNNCTGSILVEFIPNVVYYTTFDEDPAPSEKNIFFSVDKKLFYNNFYLDFGPLNIGSTLQFSHVMNKILASAKSTQRKIYFYSSPDPKLKANAVCLLGCWGVLFQHMTPEQAFAPFQHLSFTSFHDATPTACNYNLTIVDCLKGLEKALKCNYIDPITFNIQEYHHYEQVENGDLSWMSKKFIAFAGPHNVYSLSSEGYVTLTPEHYIPYFKKNNVTLVIRLNEKLYDENRFINAGIDHLDLYYPDGSNPPENILLRFIEACENTSGAVAVHCKAGLGRTGTCIGAYMIKHEKFTAKEVIGWLRLCRPGSVIGPQQQFMEAVQQKFSRTDEKLILVSPFKTKALGEQKAINIFSNKNIFKKRAEMQKSASVTPISRAILPNIQGLNKTQGDDLVQLKQVQQHQVHHHHHQVNY